MKLQKENKMTLRSFSSIISNAMSNTSALEQSAFESVMTSGKTAYGALSYEDRTRIGRVCKTLDEREFAFAKFVNSGLDLNNYKCVSSKEYPGWTPYIDCKDGDIYLIKPTTEDHIAYMDLKCSTMDGKNDYYNVKNGWHLGGMINTTSLNHFAAPNHFYILSTFDGAIILAIDSVSLRNKLRKAEIENPNFRPTPSKYESNPYYTVKNHIRFVCNLNDDVFVIRNKYNKDITCFDCTMDDYNQFIQNKSDNL